MLGKKTSDLEQEIKYSFTNVTLLQQAMRHRSRVNEESLAKKDSNERLEFLGDAVLELVTSQHLYFADENMLEGNLTKLRANLVCEPSLATCAREINLGDFLELGKGEDVSGGRNRDSLLSDAMEALIGAIYIDGGFTCAQIFIEDFILKDIEKKKFNDNKTALQELVQEDKNNSMEYKLVKEAGPDHAKTFVAEVHINKMCYGVGQGSSKKVAEQNAAYQAILKLREEKA